MDTNKNKTNNTSDKDKTSTPKGTSKDTNQNSSNESATQNSNNSTQNSSQENQDKSNQEDDTGMDEKKNSQKPSETEKGGPLFTFFIAGLKDILYAEKHLLEALPKMQKAATTNELQEAFEDHYLLTQKHVSRIEKVFKMLGEEPETKKCEAIVGIVKEGENTIKETEDGSMTRDAGLIIAAQKVEHYEIASYGGLAALAETLELYDISELLHKTLEEEEQTDELLTMIAESNINFAAKEDDQEGESDQEYDDENEEDEDFYDEEYDENRYSSQQRRFFY